MVMRRFSRKTTETNANPSFKGVLDLDKTLLKESLGENSDIQYREFKLKKTSVSGLLIYLSELSNRDTIDKDILPVLLEPFHPDDLELLKLKGTMEFLKNYLLPVSDIKESNSIDVVTSKILTGRTALIIDGCKDVLLLGIKEEKTRSLEEPLSEAVVRGPRIGFTESLSVNIAILRNSAENKDLKMLGFQVGSLARKSLMIAYISEIVNPSLLEEVKKRINKIDIDYAADSGYVEQLIEDNFLSPFPQIQSTERPDRVMAALMEGRIAILLDGSPFVLIAPVTFSMLLQSPEDYYERWIPGTLIRNLRFLAAIISLLGPSIYISFVSFHPGLIPTKLAMSIAGSREGVPFPAFIEALMMEISIEILREAGLRLPRPIGPAIGIVGGLIIGEAAVRAGIVSSIMIIVVALTAISSFAIPQYSAGISLRYLRFIFMVFAATLGLYGVTLFFLLICSHLVRLESFGVPYTSPAVPFRIKDMKDFIVRAPITLMKRRPSILKTQEPKRKE
jgi:spore germination protein